MVPGRVVEALRRELERNENVLFAYLFGSFARYPERARDIDIAVFVKGNPGPEFERELSLKLSRELGKDVDVFVLNRKPLLFLSEVFRTGVLVFSRNEKKRVEFESKKLTEVQEFSEIVKTYNRMRCARYGSG